MKYYRLIDDMDIQGRWHLGEIVGAADGEPPLADGVAYCGGPLRTELVRPGRTLNFSLTTFAVPVVSRVLGEALARVLPDDIQRIPVVVPGHEGFEVLNALRTVNCLDEVRSSFEKWTRNDHRPDLAGQYRGVTHLRVSVARIPTGAHMFRIRGWLVALVVSEVVRTAMEGVGCVGAKFWDIT